MEDDDFDLDLGLLPSSEQDSGEENLFHEFKLAAKFNHPVALTTLQNQKPHLRFDPRDP